MFHLNCIGQYSNTKEYLLCNLHGIPVTNIGTLKVSLQKAIAMKTLASSCATAPTADHFAPRTQGGIGALASGVAVTI